MTQDFFNFFLLYVIFTFMFAIIGNINFIYDLEEYEGFFESILTVIDASLGNFDISIFTKVANPNMVIVGQMYMICVIVCFNILLMNLIIAILSNTYSRFESGSSGLYLSKILSTRDEIMYDQCFGSFLSAMPPINIIQFPFFPFLITIRYLNPTLILINEYIMTAQYVMFMLIFNIAFMIVAQLLIPIAWIIGIFDKLATMKYT